jgi:myo-inositol 2-dehydrogenase/D-chiro-inositol 1-dehydrogenase
MVNTFDNSDALIKRRKFIKSIASTALSFTIIKPELVFATESGSKVKLGMIGCGSRGTWISQLFLEHGGFELVAAADYFEDRVEAFRNKFNIDPKRCYTGLSGYKRILEEDIDAVAIESPPYFHPQQAEAAIRAAKHVYLAKPVAVDVPGCKRILESGRKATTNKLCFLVDFQTRANNFFIEAIKRVHEGAIGDIAFAESSYHAGSPFKDMYDLLESDPDNSENRLRAWGLDRVLSGDIITEQNIHTLDVGSWVMNSQPVFAVGTGGHTVRKDKGSCWDHFIVLFQYPNEVGITFSSRQFEGHGTTPEGIRNRFFGSKGILETEYGGQVIIRGENFYHGGKTSQIFREGAMNNVAAFYDYITQGIFENTTVESSVRSNLVTILGRSAAYQNRQVYWEQLMASDEKLEADLRGLKD